MRFQRRRQGRVPFQLVPTRWEVQVRDLSWSGDSLVGLHHWLVLVDPKADDETVMIRNGRTIFKGSWKGLADEATLW